MFKKNSLFLLLALVINTTVLLAQENVATVTKQDEGFMRSEAKLYVVGAVVLTILLGLIIYVVRIDRKISKLEK